MQEIPRGAPGITAPYLVEMQESSDDPYAVILETVNCVGHADAVEGSKQEAPACVRDCSSFLAMEPAGRVLTLEDGEAFSKSEIPSTG